MSLLMVRAGATSAEVCSERTRVVCQRYGIVERQHAALCGRFKKGVDE